MLHAHDVAELARGTNSTFSSGVLPPYASAIPMPAHGGTQDPTLTACPKYQRRRACFVGGRFCRGGPGVSFIWGFTMQLTF